MLNFDRKARERNVMRILRSLCDELNHEQNVFIADVDEMHLNEGFGYKLAISTTGIAEVTQSAKIEMFYALHNYMQDMLSYLFNKHVDISAFSDDDAMTMEFQVVSMF